MSRLALVRLGMTVGTMLLLSFTAAAAACISGQNGMTAAAAEAEAEKVNLYENIPVTGFRVSGISPQTDTGLDYVDWWYNPREDCRYIFLPATADRRNLTITYEAKGALKLDRIPVNSGYETALLSLKDCFTITVGDQDCGEVRVMQSTLGCAYLELESGSIDYIDGHRYGNDPGTALMLDADGNVQYYGAMEKFMGHGNSSWDYSIKKPYNLKLEQKASLYGMGKAKRWALISNFLDQAMMRNTVAVETGRQAGLDVSLNSEYIDLFVNGSYRGTYQLYERPQIQKQRINIRNLEEETEDLNETDLSKLKRQLVGEKYQPDSYHYYDVPNEPADLTGGYLLQFQFAGRSGKSDFITSRGQCVQICSPEYASKAQVEYVRTMVQDLEDAVFSDDGYNSKGRHFSDYVDEDSLIIGYLIQEMMLNSDGLATSFYFYKDSDARGDGKLHYGPAWDFDLSCQNFSRAVKDQNDVAHGTMNLEDYFARYMPATSADPNATEESSTIGYSWMSKLFEKPAFLQRIAEIYYERFDPFLVEMTDQEHPEHSLIAQTAEKLAASAEMNNARWHMCGDNSKPLGPVNGYDYAECVEYLRRYFERRRPFLHDQFLLESTVTQANLLQQTVDAMDLTKYAEAEQETIAALLADYQTQIAAAETPQAAKELREQAESELQAIPEAALFGDFDRNGAVEVLDAQAVLMHYAQTLVEIGEPVSATQFRNGDVDQNGSLDAVDAMYILTYCSEQMVGNAFTLPIG